MILSRYINNLRQLLLSLPSADLLRVHSQKIRCTVREEILRQNILNSSTPGTTDTEYEQGRQLIVSLTSFGDRLQWSAPAIESIMEQTVKANRIVLWLDHEFEKPHMIPQDIIMLEKRGLEIRFTDDCGPATKLIPSLKAFPDDIIITIDDDTMYNYDIIDKLLRGHYKHPRAVISDWQTSIHMRHDGTVYYTEDDKYTRPDAPDIKPVAIGGAGVLYPPHVMHKDVMDVEKFKALSPKADDLWFKVMQLRAGTPVFCVGDTCPTGERIIAMSHSNQDLSLFRYNLLQGGNDKQLAALFEHFPEVKKFYVQ